MAARKPQHTFMKPKWPAVGMRVRVERDGEWYEGEVTALTADRSEAAVVYTEDADRFEEGGVDVGARLCGDSLLRAREGMDVEVRRGKQWRRRVVVGAERTSQTTADLTLEDDAGERVEVVSVDASLDMSASMRWPRKPSAFLQDIRAAQKARQREAKDAKRRRDAERAAAAPAPAPAAAAPPAPGGPHWIGAARELSVLCEGQWYDCCLVGQEKDGTFVVAHDDGSLEARVDADRLRERLWCRVGNKCRVSARGERITTVRFVSQSTTEKASESAGGGRAWRSSPAPAWTTACCYTRRTSSPTSPPTAQSDAKHVPEFRLDRASLCLRKFDVHCAVVLRRAAPRTGRRRRETSKDAASRTCSAPVDRKCHASVC